MADLKPCFVQFIHPGSEHGIHGSRKPWNTGEHRRKFLRARGSYMKTPDAAPERGELVFWGEWEPESEDEGIVSPLPDGPRWVHRPYYVRPASYPGDLQNTDPFVFGDCFLYTVCHQIKRIRGHFRPTFLRDLAPGSLILFGSLKAGEFVLDTALVVAEGVLHNFGTWSTVLAARISPTYAVVTMLPSYQTRWPHELRLYSGATVDEPFRGLFSFAPCLPEELAPKGFARPAIRLNGVINPRLMMGAKATRGLSVERIKELWDAVTAQVLNQGLALGVRFDLPPRRSE
jgi:hypothetical protein